LHQRIVMGKPASTAAKPPVPSMGTVDARSEGNIATLPARKCIPMPARWCSAPPLSASTSASSAALARMLSRMGLYAQGRTKPGNKVTNARGGYSNHNFGIAFDIGVFEGTSYKGDSPKYRAVGMFRRGVGPR